MTHSEWSNQQSAWFSGRNDDFSGRYDDYESHKDIPDIFPKKKGSWKPDYIIIDENIINVDLPNKKSDSGEKHPSIKQIISDVMAGKSLGDAVIERLESVFNDSFENTQPKMIFDYSIGKYITEVNSQIPTLETYSEILERLERYCMIRDPSCLQGMWVEDNKLFLAPIIHSSERYQNIPTLYLDATAQESIVKALHPNIEFHTIKIKAKSDINLYQLENSTVTKSQLKTVEQRKWLIDWIRSIITGKNYKKVGLITYIDKFDGTDCNFDEFLAKQLGIEIFSHFGAVRGLDIFEDVDCLLIIGRNYIGSNATKDLASAIFNEVHEHSSAYVDMPVRMKIGISKTINSLIPTAPYHYMIHEHFSQGETKQAIGRARTVHGNAKDVFLFSNESLGLDIEVTDFFRREFNNNMCSDEAIKNIKEIGFVQDKPSQLIQVGLAANDVRSRRPELILELADQDIHIMKGTMRDSSNRPNDYEYFVSDASKFTFGQKIDGRTFVAFT